MHRVLVLGYRVVMKFEKALQSVSTKTSLKRFASAYVMDHRNLNDDELLAALVKTAPQYYFQSNVSKNLSELSLHEDRKYRLLSSVFLKEVLLNCDSFISTACDVNKACLKFISSVIDESNEPPRNYKGRLEHDHELFSFIVQTAWELNSDISPDEKNLIDKVRRKLKISEREYYVLEARLKKFPTQGNQSFTLDDVNEVRLNLQARGLVMEVRDDGVDYDCIPLEVANSVREYYGIEMRDFGYLELLSYKAVRKKSFLRETAVDFEYSIDNNASLSDLQAVVMESIKPSELLGGLTPRGGLSVEVLKDWCADIGLPVSGRKEELIQKIVLFYDQLRHHSDSLEDERIVWYELFERLANRDISYFRSQQLITKDIEIERKFEDATNYLFESKLQHKPLSLIGTKHEDGRLSMGEGILLWDNKSSETQVNLQDHIRQFDGYIQSSEKPVEGFLVIAPSFTESSATIAMNYFVEKKVMISLITAADLKSIAEEFSSNDTDKSFNLRYLLQIGLFKKEFVKL